MKEKLYIIDTSSPFFSEHEDTVVNWSKVPYASLERRGEIRRKRRKRIRRNFDQYIRAVAAMGYTAVSVDDLCHLVAFDFYSKRFAAKIRRYRLYLRKLFAAAKARGLKVFITTDSMFSNAAIERRTGSRLRDMIAFMSDAFEKLFTDEPLVDGIIIRSGEADGVDVEGDFLSTLVIRTAAGARRYLAGVLPVFEKHGKLCIYRTWTVGAYRIGDIMWNEATYHRVFGGLSAKQLIVSMKYGESDFYRYLPLSRYFFIDDGIQKLVELQTRREYEGFGEYPSFVGWMYRTYADLLKHAPGFSGIYVWCQTGGWSVSRNYTFLKQTSVWNELNTFATIKIFRDGWQVRRAVAAFFHGRDIDAVMEFLSICEEAVLNILYDPSFSASPLYFNRTRLPPLIHVFWDHVTVTKAVAALSRRVVENPEKVIADAKAVLARMKGLKALAKAADIPYRAKFHYRTFKMLFRVKKALYLPQPDEKIEKLIARAEKYHRRYPEGYRFKIDPDINGASPVVAGALRLFVRPRRRYRILDRMLFNRISSRAVTAATLLIRGHLPDFADRQGMPLSAFFH